MFVTFKPQGFFKLEWHPESSSYVERKIDENDFFKCYRHELKTKDAPTLLDFFEALYNLGPNVCDVISQISWCNLSDFIDEVRKDSDDKSNLYHLSVSKNVHVDRYSNKENPELQIYCELSGTGLADDESGKIIDNWSVSFTPLCKMKHLEVKIKNTDTLPVRLDAESYGNPTHEFQSVDRVISLGDFVNAILYDVSFHGSPKERDAVSEDLRRRVEELDNGTAQTVSFDEFMERMKQKYLE